MLSRISGGWTGCKRVVQCVRLCSTNDESKCNKLLENAIKRNKAHMKNLKQKIKECDNDFKMILFNRMTVNPSSRIFIAFDEFLSKDIIIDDGFKQELVLDSIKSSVEPSVRHCFSYGIEPDALIKATILASVFIPFIPRCGVWFEDTPVPRSCPQSRPQPQSQS